MKPMFNKMTEEQKSVFYFLGIYLVCFGLFVAFKPSHVTWEQVIKKAESTTISNKK